MTEPPTEERERWRQSLADSVMISDKNWTTALVFSVAGGFLGLDHFYAGSPVLG
jgi:hypothetical protein